MSPENPPESAESDAHDAEDTDAGDLSGEVSAPLPGAEQLEAAVDTATGETDVEAEAPTPAASAPARATDLGTAATAAGNPTRVLEFSLGGEWYCLDIEYVEEIVGDEPVTRVPNSPAFVEGVVDLRGRITTVVNPKLPLERAEQEAGELIVVFDSEAVADGEHLGWAVDDVRRVAPVADHQVSDAPADEDHVNGVIDREDDDDLVVWTSPDLVFGAADG